MTKEEKQLLLTDLCGRLLYGVFVEYDYGDGIKRATKFHGNYLYLMALNKLVWHDFKPYLRPLSSMTDEEKKELKISIEEDLSEQGKHIKQGHGLSRDGLYLFPAKRQFDWLNAHHFDYRGLIEKGLAIEAPEGMYDFSDATIGNE